MLSVISLCVIADLSTTLIDIGTVIRLLQRLTNNKRHQKAKNKHMVVKRHLQRTMKGSQIILLVKADLFAKILKIKRKQVTKTKHYH